MNVQRENPTQYRERMAREQRIAEHDAWRAEQDAERLAEEAERKANNERLRQARLDAVAAQQEQHRKETVAARDAERQQAEQRMIAQLRATWPGTDASFNAALPGLMEHLVADSAAAAKAERERLLRTTYSM